MTYTYFEYHIPQKDLIESDMKLAAFVRKELAVLFKMAIDDGWDVRQGPLLLAHRDEEYYRVIRLMRGMPIDILEKWAVRGWNVEPMADWMREQLLALFAARLDTAAP